MENGLFGFKTVNLEVNDTNMRLLSLQIRGICIALKKIITHPVEHILNIIVLSLLICVLSTILILDKTNFQWQKNNVSYPQIMVYLNESATNKEVAKLQITISNFGRNTIKAYRYISKEQGLLELQQDEQLKNITTTLTTEIENHLPNILMIDTNTSNTKILKQLKDKVSNLASVATVELDEQYATKLSNLINFINDTSNIILVFFSICLILVIYNLVRLQMFQSHDEIAISRLIGASDVFIMHPLIYYAIIQIIISFGIAYGLVNWFTIYINNLFTNMRYLFGRSFLLAQLNYTQIGEVLIALLLFTIFAVFIAVQAVLRKYHPR